MPSASLTEFRLQLLTNGYIPLPNWDKANYQVGWSTWAVDKKLIKSWQTKLKCEATGLRIEGGLTAIDVDCTDATIVGSIADAAKVHFGADFFESALQRGREGSEKEMWLARMDLSQCTGNLATRFYLDPTDPKQTGQRVEVFCKPRSKQIGAFGPHSHDEFSNVLASYWWADGISPANTKLKDLPVIERSQVIAFLKDCDEIFTNAGYVLKPAGDSTPGDTVYNLTRDMTFDGLTFDELVACALADPNGYRITAHFMDPAAKSLKCMAHARDGGRDFWIWNYDGDIVHRLKDEDPGQAFEDLVGLEEMAADIGRMFNPEGAAKVAADNAYWRKLDELLLNLAWMPPGRGGGVDLVPYRDVPAMFHALKNTYARWYRFVQTGRSTKKVNIIEDWIEHPKRITVNEVHTRPAKPWPVYQEAGRTYVNLWRPIVHANTLGDTTAFWAFLEHLLPIATERLWFSEALAHKAQHPESPGPCIIMVADSVYGVGRSTLTEIINLLFLGRTTTMDYSELTGRSSQAIWNASRADALWCFCNEAAGEEDYTAKGRHRVYEHLKSAIDPSGTLPREFRQKFMPMWTQPSPCTDLVMTNNADAVYLPHNDRRFAVLSNGDVPMNLEQITTLRGWMAKPGNIGALWVELQAMPMTVFNAVLAPIDTEARQQMIEQGKGELEDIIDQAFEQLKAPVFYREQVFANARVLIGTSPMPSADYLAAAKHMIKRRSKFMVGHRDGPNHRHIYNGKRTSIYAQTKAVAVKWADADTEVLRRMAGQNDAILDPQTG